MTTIGEWFKKQREVYRLSHLYDWIGRPDDASDLNALQSNVLEFVDFVLEEPLAKLPAFALVAECISSYLYEIWGQRCLFEDTIMLMETNGTTELDFWLSYDRYLRTTAVLIFDLVAPDTPHDTFAQMLRVAIDQARYEKDNETHLYLKLLADLVPDEAMWITPFVSLITRYTNDGKNYDTKENVCYNLVAREFMNPRRFDNVWDVDEISATMGKKAREKDLIVY